MFEHPPRGKHRRLGIERIKHRFDQNQIGTARHQSVDLLAIGCDQLIKGNRAKAGIIDIWGKRGRAVGRTNGTCDKAFAAIALFGLDGGFHRKPCAFAVEFMHHRFHAVIGLRNGCRGEGVGFDNIRASQQVVEMDGPHRIRLRQNQQIIIALLVMARLLEARATEIRLLQR